MSDPTAEKISTDNRLAGNVVALCIAAAGVAGSLWLSMSMGLRACPLCLYQRAFVMGAMGVLAVGLLTRLRGSAALGALAMPAAAGGLGVALFHVYLEWTGKLECPLGVLGLGSAPQQSLAMFALLAAALAIASRRSLGEGSLGATAAGFALGLLFAAGTVLSAPPMPPAPETPYETPLDMCRPPYRATGQGDAPP